MAIFASVSTPQQATTDKDSLPSQVRDGQAWAEGVGGQVVAIYRVPGHSRKYIFFQNAEREIPAYRELRSDCEVRAFDVLWCRARDRLGRTDALIAQVEALVANAGAEVYSAAMPHQLGASSEASNIVLSAVERGMAEIENIQRNRRREIGVKARVRRGLPTPSGLTATGRSAMSWARSSLARSRRRRSVPSIWPRACSWKAAAMVRLRAYSTPVPGGPGAATRGLSPPSCGY